MRISRALSRFLLVGCILSAAAPYSLGQGGGERPGRGQGGGGGGMRAGGGFGIGGMASLLTMKEVREELKLDEDQTKDLDAYNKEMMEEMRSQFGAGGGPGGGGPGGFDRTKLREAMTARQEKSEAKIGDILDPIQLDRLVGLYIQRDGVRTLSSKTISTKLEITADQKEQIAKIEKAAGEEMQASFAAGGPPGGDFREKMEKMRKDNEAKITGVLTEVQKAKMEDLKGAKFEFPAQPQRGPGGPGGPGGGRGRDRGTQQ